MARDYEHTNTAGSTTDLDPGADIAHDWDEPEQPHAYRRIMPAGALLGNPVRNSAGEHLGKIEDVMLDLLTGRIAYGVLSFGGTLGLGKKLFAVPWEALTLNERDREFVLNVEKETLKNAPGFDKDHWPDMADPGWGTKVHMHYGYRPYWESAMRKTDQLDRGEREGTFDRDRR